MTGLVVKPNVDCTIIHKLQFTYGGIELVVRTQGFAFLLLPHTVIEVFRQWPDLHPLGCVCTV